MGETKAVSVSTLKVGSYIILDGAACRVVSIQVSKPGKHGHAKARLEGIGLIDEKKRVAVMPGHDNVDVPIIDKRDAQVLSVNSDVASVMDSETFETFDLRIPEELKGKITGGKTVVYWQILDDKVMKQFKGD